MTYRLNLTPAEAKALAWIADRYQSATVLWDGAEHEETDAGTILTIPEHVAWDYAEALPRDNGVPGACLPPCAGGPLAEKLLDFLDSIV